MHWWKVILINLVLSVLGSMIIAEWRIQELRPYVQRQAIQIGVETATEAYKAEYLKGEHLSTRKRAARDEMVKRYVKRLENLMEGKEK